MVYILNEIGRMSESDNLKSVASVNEGDVHLGYYYN